MAFELFALTGKRALITGSSQGIGFALAQDLSEHGAEVVLNGRDASKLDVAAAKRATAGHKVSLVGFDGTHAGLLISRVGGSSPPANGLERTSMDWQPPF